jgi:O-antigen polymerase
MIFLKLSSINLHILLSLFFCPALIYFTNRESNILYESFYLAFLAVCLSLVFLFLKDKIQFHLLEIACLLIYILIVLKNIFQQSLESSLVANSSFILLLYVVLRVVFSSMNKIGNAIFIIVAILLLLFSILAAYHLFYLQQSINSLYNPTSSIFSILLSAQIIFILQYVFTNKKYSWLFYVVSTAAVLLLLYTNGRAGWLGFIVASCFIIYQSIKNTKFKKRFLYVALFVVPFIIASLFFYKVNSSNGRLLIQKVSLGIWQKSWLLGIGQGKFKVQFNEAQAEYFSSNNIDSKEALLADDTFYAFNDFFQFVIENGVLGLLFLICFGWAVFKAIKNIELTRENRTLFIAAVSSLLAIAVGASLSYALQTLPILLMALICIAIIFSMPQNKTSNQFCLNATNLFVKNSLIIVAISFSIYYYFSAQYNIAKQEASELNKVGFKTKAIKMYSELSNSMFAKDEILYYYANTLFLSNQSLKAKKVLAEAKKYYLAKDVYTLSAQIENDLKNYKQAEADYKTAIFMVPNRMATRKNLLDFYLIQKDTANALYWAKSILNMPVKVPSNVTESILKNTKIILSKIDLEEVKNINKNP